MSRNTTGAKASGRWPAFGTRPQGQPRKGWPFSYLTVSPLLASSPELLVGAERKIDELMRSEVEGETRGEINA